MYNIIINISLYSFGIPVVWWLDTIVTKHAQKMELLDDTWHKREYKAYISLCCRMLDFYCTEEVNFVQLFEIMILFEGDGFYVAHTQNRLHVSVWMWMWTACPFYSMNVALALFGNEIKATVSFLRINKKLYTKCTTFKARNSIPKGFTADTLHKIWEIEILDRCCNSTDWDRCMSRQTQWKIRHIGN